MKNVIDLTFNVTLISGALLLFPVFKMHVAVWMLFGKFSIALYMVMAIFISIALAWFNPLSQRRIQGVLIALILMSLIIWYVASMIQGTPLDA